MATISFTDAGGLAGTVTVVIPSQTINVTYPKSTTYTFPACQVKCNGSQLKGNRKYKLTDFYKIETGWSGSVASNVYATTPAVTKSVGTPFSSNNKTVRTVTLEQFKLGSNYICVQPSNSDSVAYPSSAKSLLTVTATLDAPPTYTAVVNTSGVYYQGLSPYTVTISDAVAKYGGDITKSSLTIGGQTVNGSGNGSLTITPQSYGTFTPTVSVTDSRGQVTTKTLPEITVLDYQKPSIQSFELARSNSDGVVSDEGLNALLSVNYSYYGSATTLVKPTVKKNNTDISNSVNWYSSISASGVSSPITFPYSAPSTGTIYGVLTTTTPIVDSAQIALTLGDSLGGQSTEITQVLPQAFYTIDFLAGGKGVAFGSPATEEKFKVAMPAEFEDIVAENITAEEALLQLDTSAASGTDKEIYDALVSLGWDSDVIV